MKRYAYITGMALFMSFILALPVLAEEQEKQADLNLTEDAKASILLERDTGDVLYEKNAHEKLPPASMTKVMTLLLIMEAIAEDKLSLDEQITISERASSMGGSQVFLAEGEQMSVDDLIKAIAIASGNDASVALAERIAGSEEAFVQLMNDKVKELTLENTNFVNSSGLPAENHYTTAYDMAMIAKELLKYEKVINYTSIYEDYLRKGEENEFWLVNTNKLVRFYPYVDGLKTGYTSEAKFCLTATAKKDDMRVVSVVMGADSAKNRNAMTMNLIDYAFNHYESEKLYDPGEKVASLRHIQSEKWNYDIKTSEQISLLHKKGEKEAGEVETAVKIKEDIQLPIHKGEQVGTMTVKKGDNLQIESPLIVEENVEIASYFTLFKRSLQNIAKYNQ
ncbi:D-alanyl-D-alanine carboxypeptidase family protein [Pseudogracilibacillus auburnensis]|uniref:serine-type D-Ala-D-Ala carboxypeptidase n=1 Tax=Pseudogracilibacillus auburnensis TaxID=1494959 RepID=A0A2V3W676_9BACI|nr:D-alanyl-D-alanine carboxypeptidase family protein [Pseudogracilibacillus auburnensis]PXW88694.1 D-Ala-D-Ala carboxypeptidase DacF [Pseudogracilibacillus auburnensis]